MLKRKFMQEFSFVSVYECLRSNLQVTSICQISEFWLKRFSKYRVDKVFLLLLRQLKYNWYSVNILWNSLKS